MPEKQVENRKAGKNIPWTAVLVGIVLAVLLIWRFAGDGGSPPEGKPPGLP